jgi:hypothetical protein
LHAARSVYDRRKEGRVSTLSGVQIATRQQVIEISARRQLLLPGGARAALRPAALS